MSDGTLVSINKEFDNEIRDTDDLILHMLGIDHVKRQVEHNEGSLFGFCLTMYRGFLMQVQGNENVPESEQYEEAFSLFEGEMEMAKARFIQSGRATASDFEGRGCTYKTYMSDFKRAAEFKVNVLAAGKDGGYMIESKHKMNAASTKAKKELEERKAVERAARRKAAGFTPEVVSGNGGPEGKNAGAPATANYLDLEGMNKDVEAAMRAVYDKALEFQGRKDGVKEFTNYVNNTLLRKLDTILKMNCREAIKDLKDSATQDDTGEQEAKTGTNG